MIGTEFAGYQVEAQLGRGGMGVVYRATDPSLDRRVALKLVAPTLADDEDFRKRFIAESKVAASLDHPNVIPIYQAGDWDGNLFLVMRFVAGDDLRTLIRSEGRLDPARAARIAAQIAAALDAAHDEGLVHRDVKPANVLVAPRDHAYLTDFGLTKRLAADTAHTQTGQLLGTVDYVAPEQIRGQAAGPTSDVYALGCLLFHALTGHVPYPAETTEAKLWAHLSQPPPAVSEGVPGVPAALDAVLARAMSKEPEDRFPTAGEFAAAAVAAAGPPGPGATPLPDAVRPGRVGHAIRRAGGLVPRPQGRLAGALLDPFNLLVVAAMLLAGALLGALALTIDFAAGVYAVAAGWRYLEDAPAERPVELSTHPPRRARPGA